MASVIETHPQRQQIIDSILAGRSIRDIVSFVTPPVSVMTVQRYRAKVVAPTIANAANLRKVLTWQGFDAKETLIDPQVLDDTRAALAADPILSRISEHQETVDSVLKNAKKENDARGVAALVSTDLKGLELHARLTGRLEAAAGPAVNITINCPVGQPAQDRPAIDVEAITVDIGSK